MVEISIWPVAASLRVRGQHLAHDLALLFAHAALVVQREIAAALDPAAHLRVVGLELLVEPGELRPHLQVAQFLGAEHVARAGFLLCVARVEQLAVARIAVDHVRRIGIERMLQQELALVLGQVSAGLSASSRNGSRACPAAYSSTCAIMDGTRLKVCCTLREIFQDAHHAVVVFERVHARPGKLVFAGSKVLIERLVHVP